MQTAFEASTEYDSATKFYISEVFWGFFYWQVK